MGYRLIETTTLEGRKRVQWKSTGHNGNLRIHPPDETYAYRKKQAALVRLAEARKPRHLPRAGKQ